MKFNKQSDCVQLEKMGWTYDLFGKETMKVLVPKTFLGIKLPFEKEEVIDVTKWGFAYRTVINDRPFKATVLILVDEQNNIRSYFFENKDGQNGVFSFFVVGELLICEDVFIELVKGHLEYCMEIN